MKRLLTLLIFAISLQTYAQLPDAFNYQATIRAESGDLLVNTNVNFKVTIFEGQGVGDSYVESHFVSTDDLGHVNFVVGYGQPLEGSMAEIDWSMGNYFMKVELDTGQGFVDMGDTQLLSVPYALYAMDSGGEAGDLQSVLDAGSEAEILLSDDNLAGLKVMSTGGNNIDGNYNGIQSIVSGTNINGRNTALSGISTGESSFRNYGVWGTGQGSTGINSGVVATTTGQVGSNYAFWGYANSSEALNIAGLFQASGGNTAAGENYGIIAQSNSVVGDGLAGTNFGIQVAASGALNNYGIYASAPTALEGSQNFAGYFAGDVYVNQSGYLKAENQPVADNDVVNKAYLESVLQAYDDRLAALEEVVESLQESGSLLVDQDGNILLTEEYGEDTWTTENAKVVTYRDGTPIPYVATMTEAFDSSIGHWTYANGDPSSGKILYNYKAVQGIWDADSAGDPSQRKELAPEGWHVPTHEEWDNFHNLMISIYGAEYAKAVSSQSGWIDYAIQNTPGTNPEMNNVSGFNLDPAGYSIVGDPNPIAPGGISVLWTSEYELNSEAAGYYYVETLSSAPYLSLLAQGDAIPTNQYFLSVRFVQGEAEDNNVINLPNNLGLVGDAINDWGGSEPDTPLIYLGNGQYEVNVTFTDGEFKFRENNDWAMNYGDNGADGTLDVNGENIAVTAGDYLVSVNWLDMTYTLQQNGYCGDGIVSVELGEECDDGNNDPNDGCDGCIIVENDLDGDGYSVAQGDCDDNNANVYPGALELCDQVDNNCNGGIDENDLGESFLGDYVLSFVSGGIAAAAYDPIFGDGVTVNLFQGSNDGERIFNVVTYPGLDFTNAINVPVAFEICGGYNYISVSTSALVGCNGDIMIGGGVTTSFNPGDDSQFQLSFHEDMNGSSCGEQGTTTYIFTKVN